MKSYLSIIVLMIILGNNLKGQCFAPTTLYSSNTNYYNTTVNWTSATNVHHYKIRYKIVGNNSWSYKYNISAISTTKLLNNLQPLSQYIWQIMTHCDTLNTNNSAWSLVDTFNTTTNNCPNATNLFTDNINHNNAVANWDTINGANRYKVHYRILGDTSWLNLAFIYPPNNSVTIPLLQQSTTYEWQIMTYHDNTNLASSMWSMSDTFTTSLFVPAPFNPNVTNSIGSVQCNVPTELTLEITQQSNEPDIGTSEITSTGGYFNLGLFSMGDSVGYAIMNNNNQIVESTLRLGISLSSLAIINSFDTSGSLLGFFTIENTATGIKVSTTSPNDGNNYTSGYSSEVSFTNIFVTPPNSGPLYFFIDIESELSDQIIQTDTIQIYCNTSLQEEMMSKKVIKTYSLLGKKIYGIKNGVDINLHKDGSVKKVIKIK